MTAAFDLADTAQCVGVDLWNHRSADGRSLRAAVDFLAPWAGREQAWSWPELDKTETGGLYEVFQRAAWAWSEPGYADKTALYGDRNGEMVLNLLVPAYAFE